MNNYIICFTCEDDDDDYQYYTNVEADSKEEAIRIFNNSFEFCKANHPIQGIVVNE